MAKPAEVTRCERCQTVLGVGRRGACPHCLIQTVMQHEAIAAKAKILAGHSPKA